MLLTGSVGSLPSGLGTWVAIAARTKTSRRYAFQMAPYSAEAVICDKGWFLRCARDTRTIATFFRRRRRCRRRHCRERGSGCSWRDDETREGETGRNEGENYWQKRTSLR